MFDLLKKKISGFAEKILGSATQKRENNTEATLQTKIEPSVGPDETTQSTVEEKKADILTIEAESEPEEEIEEEINAPSITQKMDLPEIRQKEDRELKANVGIFQKIEGLFRGTITLHEDTVNAFLEEFELSLLEADVEINTANALVRELAERLRDKTISSQENPTQIILGEIKEALRSIMDVEPINLDQKIETTKPCIILILGPNGAGKTTTIAKLTYRYQKKGKKIIWGSADTFRAGSIEQLQTHADKLGVRLVKHQYGADPAAVAFDAIKAARTEKADIVIIDTAGRQDTNKNLLEELKKIQRVIQPHVKLYVGESYTGQATLTQAKKFDETIGIDGFVLTKLDTDTKGGGVISILYNLKKPIAFFGIGQEYEDLIPFNMHEFLERLIPNS